MSATLMRRILVDCARSLCYQKRGAGAQTVLLDENLDRSPQRDCGLMAIDEALDELASFDPRKSKVVELKSFGGLTADEIAEVLLFPRRRYFGTGNSPAPGCCAR